MSFSSQIDRVAMGLLTLNLKKGDRIGILLPNRYEWPLLQMAAAKTGLILVTLNPAYQARELEFCIKKLGIRCIATQETFKTQDYYKMLTTIIPEIANTKPADKVKSTKQVILNPKILSIWSYFNTNYF